MVANATPDAGPSRMIGVNDQSLTVTTDPIRTRLALTEAPSVAVGVVGGRKRVFLNVEGVKGNVASGVLTVILTAPDSSPGDADAETATTMVFFGLANATSTEGPHGGSGLSQIVDVTEIANRLADGGAVEALDAHVMQPEGSEGELTVDRISIFVREEP